MRARKAPALPPRARLFASLAATTREAAADLSKKGAPWTVRVSNLAVLRAVADVLDAMGELERGRLAAFRRAIAAVNRRSRRRAGASAP